MLPLLAELGIEASPALISLGANLLHHNHPSPYQQELSKMASVFKNQATEPLDQNLVYKQGLRSINERDKANREALLNAASINGSTNQAALSSMDKANQTYTDALNNLMGRAQQYRDNMQSRYLNVLGAQENARRYNQAQFQNNLQNIINPLSSAANAFTMASMFGSNDLKAPKATLEGTGGFSDLNNYVGNTYNPSAYVPKLRIG